jgi:hypothetical protein
MSQTEKTAFGPFFSFKETQKRDSQQILAV